jgi:hypothetical protein
MGSSSVPCRYLVNETNWRFSSKGSQLNKAFHAAVRNLKSLVEAEYPNAEREVGKAYSVPVPSSNDLLVEQGCRYVGSFVCECFVCVL